MVPQVSGTNEAPGPGQMSSSNPKVNAIMTLANPIVCEIVHDMSLESGLTPTPESNLPPPIIPTAAPATLPNWEASCKVVVSSMSPFIREPVNPQHAEYQVLLHLLPSHQFQINKIERVVNNG